MPPNADSSSATIGLKIPLTSSPSFRKRRMSTTGSTRLGIPSVKLFRQNKARVWDDPIKEMKLKQMATRNLWMTSVIQMLSKNS
jgi:hypothetical protein